ncbi:activating signal cointegrator 1 complex subunit 2 homolog [Cimex lectularius]|uniref:CPR type cuticle protein n=1 Tax=Cimex lectularius TaxID=79782 RepID=A0A8I6S7M7_CIMLE|nr:activating signal cointegrator 1 complex subunit 2 homolog [Cimex lectularius]
MNALVILVAAGFVALAHAQAAERQTRLEDIERDNLKSTQQQYQQQPQPTQYQTAPAQYQTPTQYLAQQQLFAHPQYTPSQLSAYHQQLLFAQQQQQPVYVPQHQPLPFPIMLIPSPYLFSQDVNSLYLQGVQQAKYRPAQVQQVQQVKPFRPSPQIQYNGYTPQYNAYQTVYQQKYPTGAKSTVAPPLKDNYVQPNNFNYKLQ